MGPVKVKDILTKEEKEHINNLKMQMGQTKSILTILRAWITSKRILKLAESRYLKGIKTQNIYDEI